MFKDLLLSIGLRANGVSGILIVADLSSNDVFVESCGL